MSKNINSVAMTTCTKLRTSEIDHRMGCLSCLCGFFQYAAESRTVGDVGGRGMVESWMGTCCRADIPVTVAAHKSGCPMLGKA